MKEHRESLQRELEDRGYRVLPEQELPEDAQGYAKSVEEDLQAARLSVHLIGARYGSMPEGAERSGVEMQAELALARRDTPLSTILWSPPELTVASLAEERQREFVERLEQAGFDPHRAEFVRSSVEQLKALVFERLSAPQAPASPAAGPQPAGRNIYLACDPIDRADAKPLQAALSQLGFEVMRPSLEGTPEELMEENKANLVNCDVLVIVWGRAREVWVQRKLREAQQSPGWGRDRPFRGRVVVIGPPDSDAKRDFGAPAGVIVLRGASLADELGRLLQ
jgi:hypothetical protein